MKTPLAAAALALATLAAGPAAADDRTDAMMALASKSGCLACHQVEPGARPDGSKPIGPPWKDVAAKYKGVAGASDSLTRTVMTGSNPYASHWKGKVSGLAMPPNAVAISEGNARTLVDWILSL